MLSEQQKKNLEEESENALEALREARRKYLAKQAAKEQQKTKAPTIGSERCGAGVASPDGQHPQT